MFVIIILIDNSYKLIVHAMLLLKNKFNIIDMNFLQNNCFD